MLAPCEVDDAIPSSKETPPPLVALDCEPFKCCWNSEPTAPREEGALGALFTGGTTTPVSESDEGASDEAVNTFDSANCRRKERKKEREKEKERKKER